jgi:predicted phosphoribosyltransferase
VAFNENIFQEMKIAKTAIESVIQSEKRELSRREKIYRNGRIFPNLKDKAVILVDDGIATGATMRAAIIALQQLHPEKIIVAVPVAPLLTSKEISRLVDKFVCLMKPEDFYSVGAYYNSFDQTTDEEVSRLLSKEN